MLFTFSSNCVGFNMWLWVSICGVPTNSKVMPLSLFRYSNIPEIGTTALGNAESIFEKSIWKSLYPFLSHHLFHG